MHRVRFAFELAVCAGIGAAAGVVLRHRDDLRWMLYLLGFGLAAAFLAHLLLGLVARWRYHYVAICRFFSLVLVAIACFGLAANVQEKSDQQAADDYLALIKPALESFHRDNGHYPDDLGEIPSLPAAPPGFVYQHVRSASADESDAYRVDDGTREYWSESGEWTDAD